MTESEIPLNGVRLTPDPTGALLWRERGWLMVADLHFEKGSAYAARGRLLPPYDTGATLGRLEEACRRLAPTRVICLGDSFHDRTAAERVGAEDGRRIAALTASFDWIWIAGNHDPAPPAGWGGRTAPELTDGPVLLRHEAAVGPVAGEISGHYHPKAAVTVRGRRLGARCFVGDGRRLILPAFGAFTGGLDVRNPAISRLLAPQFSVWLLGRDRVHRFPSERLGGEPVETRRPGARGTLRAL